METLPILSQDFCLYIHTNPRNATRQFPQDKYKHPSKKEESPLKIQVFSFHSFPSQHPVRTAKRLLACPAASLVRFPQRHHTVTKKQAAYRTAFGNLRLFSVCSGFRLRLRFPMPKKPPTHIPYICAIFKKTKRTVFPSRFSVRFSLLIFLDFDNLKIRITSPLLPATPQRFPSLFPCCNDSPAR